MAAKATQLKNVTSLVKSAKADSKALQKFLNQALHQCSWILETEHGRVSDVCENFETVWGTSPEILHDGLSGFMKQVHPNDRDRVLSEFHLKLDSTLDSPLDVEFRILVSEDVRWIRLRSFRPPLEIFPFGNHLLFVATDVTLRKSSEEAVRLNEADLVARARLQAVGDLASGVAHEINNPLTIIVGKAAEIRRLISSDVPTEERKASVLVHTEKIQKTSIRISEIVGSLKSLSRPEKHTRPLRYPLTKLFQEVRDMCSERFRAHHVTLEMPEPPPDLEAEINPTLISQLLLNLINNAHDAVEALADRWVRVEWFDDVDSIFLSVTDSGSGIPIKIRSRIFDPFFTTKDPGRGTGLGLSLAASIASHHHGALRLDTLHSHTRFTVQLPKRQPSVD